MVMEIPYTIEERPDTGLYNAKIGVWLFLASEVMLFGALFSSYVLLRVGSPAWPHGLLNVPLGLFNAFVLITSSITMMMAWATMKMGDPAQSRKFLGLTVLCAAVFLGVKTKEYYDKFHHYEVRLTDGTVMDGHIKERSADFRTQHFKADRGHIVFEALGAYQGKPGDSMALVKSRLSPAERAQQPAHAPERRIEASQIEWISNYLPKHSTYFAIYFALTGLHGLHIVAGLLVLGYFWGPGFGMAITEPVRYANRLEVAGLFWHFVDIVWIFLFPVLYLL
jgi:cytochrome c oxidase subunit 3